MFLRSTRMVTADLNETTFTVNYHHLNQITSYDLRDARLFTFAKSLKITLLLATAEKLCFHAHDATEFVSWKRAFMESIEWDIKLFYELQETLGQGAFATVVRGIHRQTRDVVAIKELSKTLCNEQDLDFLQREIDILLALKHPNVIRMSDLFESPETLYVVLDYMDGGTLHSFIASNSPLSEANVRDVMRDILSGVQYVHSKGIVHRDIKILDFGLSRVVSSKSDIDPNAEEVGLGPDGLMTSPVGTPSFAAPEMLSGLPYGEEVDCFACGVVMYWLLCGYFPFSDSDPDRLLALIKQTTFDFPKKEWSGVSDEAKHVIRGLLDRSPYERFTAEHALQHPWFRKTLPTEPIQKSKTEEERMYGGVPWDKHTAGGNIDFRNLVNVKNIGQAGQADTVRKRHVSLQVQKIPNELDDWKLLERPPKSFASWKR
ncbi:unnamed protein product [Agarophyton chilense]